MMNVLIVRTSSMGDLIHTLPAITDLVKHYPNIRITWVAEERFADIPALHPAVVRVIPIAWRRWRKSLSRRETWREMRRFREALRDTRWDWVVDSQGLVKSAIPARLSGGPLAGYDAKSIREPLASLFYHKRYRVGRDLSAIERNRRLFGQVFGYEIDSPPVFGVVPGDRPDFAPPGRYAVFLHATSRASKEWPEARWIEAGCRLAADKGLAVVLPWGSEAERDRAERLARAIPGACVAPPLTLRHAAGLLGHAAAVIGVDTGLTHLANALAVPLVAIYTDTDPFFTGVVENEHALNCGGIGAVPTVDEVLERLASRRNAP
ncbi:lipopolysaccharide heptosyltransferase I [Paludibacterium paludis]|uniref:Lipopolysaccharide heptosyltransferase 1 n=1 Tax=Paludibacterium paludis TaxID=1225769 RepID=A0A918P0Y5_9NEIS|nr:lipopolysaccharide heptosyltransferase I [Paludibacterium paludis]GGY12436.1 lipopolysaccharide heptosyltransferase I [Paludibacterium paludis]